MATYNDISTVIKNIDEFLGTAHIVKYLPERYSSTPTKTFANSTKAQEYTDGLYTKYTNTIGTLNTKWSGIYKKLQDLKTAEGSLSNLNIVNLIPGTCNVSYSEIFYKIAGSKHTIVKAVTTTTPTSGNATTTTTTTFSTVSYAEAQKDWGLQETNTVIDPDPNATTAGSSSSSSSSSSGTTTSTATTTTTYYSMFPLAWTTRYTDKIYKWSIVQPYLWFKFINSSNAYGTYIQRRLYNGTSSATAVTAFETLGKRFTGSSSDTYTVDSTTHKTNGSNEDTDTTAGWNTINKYYWWVKEPANDTDAGHTAGDGQNNTQPSTSPWTNSDTTFKYGSLLEDWSTYNVTYNGTKANTHEYWFNGTTAPVFKANNDTVNNANTYVINHNLEFLGIDHNPASIKKSLTPQYSTVKPTNGYSMGAWSWGDASSKCYGQMGLAKTTVWVSPDSLMTNQFSTWLNYYNTFAAVGEWMTPERVIEYLVDKVVPIIPKKYIDANPHSICNGWYDGNGGGSYMYNNSSGGQAVGDYNQIKRAGDIMKAFKYTIIPGLTSDSTATKTLLKFPINHYANISIGSEPITWIQLYYTATAIRRAWRYYTGMTLTDNVVHAIENETVPTTAAVNVMTVNGTTSTSIPKGWFDGYGDYALDMTVASVANETYADTSSYKFNAGGEWGTTGLDYMEKGANGDAVVDSWAKGVDANHSRAQIVIKIQDNNIEYYLVGPSTSTSNATNIAYQYASAVWVNQPSYNAQKKAVTTAYLNAAAAWEYVNSKEVDPNGVIAKWCANNNNFKLITQPYGATVVIDDFYNRKNDTSLDMVGQYTNFFNKDLMCFKSELLNGDIKVTTDEY